MMKESNSENYSEERVLLMYSGASLLFYQKETETTAA
jgi:hypothetical protein